MHHIINVGLVRVFLMSFIIFRAPQRHLKFAIIYSVIGGKV